MTTAETAREDFRKVTRGYAGFQMATALVVAAKAKEVVGAEWVICLFAISVPSTLAYGTFFLRTEFGRRPGIGFCAFLAFIPSVAALSLLLWPASKVGSIFFAGFSVVWTLYMNHLSKAARKHLENAKA